MSGTPYMEWTKGVIKNFLGSLPVKVDEVLFIPYAGVTIPWDSYTRKVQDALVDINIKVQPIHKMPNYVEAVKQARCIMIGGGNTFHLLHQLYKYNLIEAIRERVLGPDRIPYIGWSAGSNVAGPDIGTTNDMPIIWPPSDKALDLVPYNINPHYNEWSPPNFQGETRADRLNECVAIKKRPLVAISEGVGIRVEEDGVHRIVMPELDCLANVEGGDQRCVKVWQLLDDGQPHHAKFDPNAPLSNQMCAFCL